MELALGEIKNTSTRLKLVAQCQFLLFCLVEFFLKSLALLFQTRAVLRGICSYQGPDGDDLGKSIAFIAPRARLPFCRRTTMLSQHSGDPLVRFFNLLFAEF